MFSIGLTGGIGSGKSLVAEMLLEFGAAVIDTDAIAHALTNSTGAAMSTIRAAFGHTFVRADGALDRARMRALVFDDADARTRLQAILHPMIRREAERRAALAREAYTVFVVPLLVESGRWRARVTRVCVIDCEEDEQRARVHQRSGLTLVQINRIMESQATRAARLAAADDVIHNGKEVSIMQLREQIQTLHTHWCALASRHAAQRQTPPRSPQHGDSRA